MKRSVKLACHGENSNIAIGSLPKLQISLGIVALIERFMMKSRFLPSFQISGRMYIVQYRCFNKLYDVKRVSQPVTIALLGNNYSLQMIETGFAEQF
jgi:hypothetical protein